jgi:hypothetical protein
LAACLEEIKLGARIRVGNSARNRNSTAQENLDHDATDHGGQLQTTGIIRSKTNPCLIPKNIHSKTHLAVSRSHFQTAFGALSQFGEQDLKLLGIGKR